MSKAKDLVGLRFGKLVVLSRYGAAKKRAVWVCKCDCGKTKTVSTYNLTGGDTRSCGCLKLEIISERSFKGFERLSLSYLNRFRAKCKHKHIICEITLEYCWELLEQQRFLCALSGAPIDVNRNLRNRQTASIDRIVPGLGYVQHNIRWVHKTVNSMRWNLDDGAFLGWCFLVLNPLLVTSDESHKPFEGFCEISENIGCNHKNFRGAGVISGEVLCRIRQNASRRNLVCDMTCDKLLELWNKQCGRCAITGVSLKFASTTSRKSGDEQTASLDRIDSNVGYVEGNVRWLHKTVNAMRLDLTDEEFISWCHRIVEHTESKVAA